MTESEIPSVMEQYGFKDVSAGYVTVNLTPDNPDIPRELAYKMMNEPRDTALDAIRSTANAAPELFGKDEVATMMKLTNDKYDLRLRQYDNGEKQWDTQVSITMIIRGVK